MRTRTLASSRGFGLVSVLLWLSLLGVMALGVALTTSAEPPATGAMHERLRLTRAAESAVNLVVAQLASQADWRTAPSGLTTPFTDGAPGARTLGDTTIDLPAETRRRTCGRSTPCDEVATTQTTPSRPWGVRNPRWQLVLHQPLADIDAVAGAVCACYLVAWVSDDPADADGDPLSDAPAGSGGHGVLLVRGAAFGPRGGLAEVEALVAQPCRRSNAPCGGSRVQSWGEVREAVP